VDARARAASMDREHEHEHEHPRTWVRVWTASMDRGTAPCSLGRRGGGDLLTQVKRIGACCIKVSVIRIAAGYAEEGEERSERGAWEGERGVWPARGRVNAHQMP
jgi:hypothetical protein